MVKIFDQKNSLKGYISSDSCNKYILLPLFSFCFTKMRKINFDYGRYYYKIEFSFIVTLCH